MSENDKTTAKLIAIEMNRIIDRTGWVTMLAVMTGVFLGNIIAAAMGY